MFGGNRTFENLANAAGTDIELTGANANFPLLVTLTHSNVNLMDGATLLVPQVTDFDGSSIYVRSGTTVSFPAVTAYVHATLGNGQHRYLEAEGTGSRLQFPNLTLMTGGNSYNNTLQINAKQGGTIQLPQVKQILDPADGDLRYRSINIIADGNGSLIELDRLVELSDQAGFDFGELLYSTISARSGATIAAPQLTNARGTNIELNSSSTLSIGQLSRLISGRIELQDKDQSFPDLTDVANSTFVITGSELHLPSLKVFEGGVMTVTEAASVLVPQLSQIDGSTFDVSGASTLVVAQATSYDAATSSMKHFRASDEGSTLAFPNLLAISGASGYDSHLKIEALAGATVGLPNVVQIFDPVEGDVRYRSLDILAEGNDSSVQLDRLAIFVDRYGSTSGGEDLESTITERDGGRVTTPLLTTTFGVHITRGSASTTDISNSDSASSGASPNPDSTQSQLTSTNVQTAVTQDVTSQTVRWVGGDGNWSNSANWSTGALPGENDDVVLDVAESSLTISVDLDIVVRSITSSENLIVRSGASLTVSQNSTINGSLVLEPSSKLRATGAAAVFQATGSATIDGANLTASEGGRIELPTATTYFNTSSTSLYRTILADGPNSQINLGGVVSIRGDNTYNSRILFEARNGGNIDLRSLATISDAADGDMRYRSIDLIADGVASRIRLDLLSEFVDNYAYDFGEVLFSSLQCAQWRPARSAKSHLAAWSRR